MMMRLDCSIYNLALKVPENKKTGCCVTSSHFENKDNILYDKGNRLTYIHYIGISSQIFKKVCQGENIDFLYRDIFLYYRYYHNPENLPKFTEKAVYYQQQSTLTKKNIEKIRTQLIEEKIMTRGIYITANDKVIEQAIALLKSIRCYDQDTPVVLIPYDDNYQVIAKKLNEDFGVTVYPDLEFIERLSIKLQSIFGEDFFARPNQFRKQACWFGEFDEFLYIDTDIVVFKKIVDDLNYFTDYDFICYDYQHKAGIRNVFSQKIIDNKVFTEDELKGMFNGGFWASKKGLMSEEKIYQIFEECAANIDYFDFTYKTSDQPIINYMVLKNIERRFNLAHQPDKNPGNWAGTGHFQQEGYQLIDPSNNQNLHYLHWAGIKIKPGCPYWDVWKHYRYLGETAPDDAELIKTETGIKTQIFQQVKKILKGK